MFARPDQNQNTRESPATSITLPATVASSLRPPSIDPKYGQQSNPYADDIVPTYASSRPQRPVVRTNVDQRSPISPTYHNQGPRDGSRVDVTSATSDGSELALSPAIKASYSDPFNSWPVTCYRDLDENFGFLVNSFGPSTFGYLPNNRGFDIFRPMVRIALSDPAAFHALMIAPVIRKGEVTGQQLPGMNALWHQMEALRIMKERIESGNNDDCVSEGSIYAVMVLMGISKQWGAIGRDEFDPSALNKLILRKGGLDVISQHYPILEMSIYGMSVMTSGLLRSDLYKANGLNVSVDEKQDVKVLLYSLLGFIRGTAELRQRPSTGLGKIQAAFSAGTPARALLVQAPNHPGIHAHQQRRLRRRLMLHSVLYIFSILLWASPTIIQEFIMHLQFVLSNSRIWRHSLKLFDWCLGVNLSRGALMFPKQAWQSYELLCAVQCLDEQLQDDILAFYRGLLTLEIDTSLRPEDLMGRIGSIIYENS